jgi:hypothetical protein
LKKLVSSVRFGFGFINKKPNRTETDKKPEKKTEPKPSQTGKTEPKPRKPSQTGLNRFLP